MFVMLCYVMSKKPRDSTRKVVAPQGMDGVSHLEQGPGAIENLCAKVWCKTPFMMWTLTVGFGVLGHLGMGLVRWCLGGWMELAIWSRDLGPSKTCAPKCGAKRRL